MPFSAQLQVRTTLYLLTFLESALYVALVQKDFLAPSMACSTAKAF